VDVGLVLRLLAEVVLGERRAFVRAVRLLSDQDQTAFETFMAQGLRSFGPGQTGPDDDEGLVSGHARSLVVALRPADRQAIY